MAEVRKPEENNGPSRKRLRRDSFVVSDQSITAALREKYQDSEVLDKLQGLAHLQHISIPELADCGLDIAECCGVRRVIDVVLESEQSLSMSNEIFKKVFNDPVHGHIELHPLLIKVVDTPQFQRLRDIKQLGACYHVFPGASHNRFEHCLGVAHLAGQLVRQLHLQQPELGITQTDMLCVQMAGLCHDLGHGPFSHLFDGKFVPQIDPSRKWAHEEGSVLMFEHMLRVHDLLSEFERHGLTERDVKFVKEQIAGPQKRRTSSEEYHYEGRERAKSFLYEIVANKRNGIDVDKWDYFARDCHHLGIRNNFDHQRFIKFVRVILVDGELQLCSRDKEVGNLYDMFYTRKTLHRRAYQHNVTRAVDLMVSDAFVLANNFIKIPGTNGRMCTMLDCIDDMTAFTKLSDRVYYDILWSTDDHKDMVAAREILMRLETRQLYKFVGQTQRLRPGPNQHSETFNAADLAEFGREIVEETNKDLSTRQGEPRRLDPVKDLTVDVLKLDYGMKSKNPVDEVRFYRKDSPYKAEPIPKHHVSQLLPDKFAEYHLRLYYRRAPEKGGSKPLLPVVQDAFKRWCSRNSFNDPMITADMTPLKSFGTPEKGSSGRNHDNGLANTIPAKRQLTI